MTQTFSSDTFKEVGGKIEPYTIVIMAKPSQKIPFFRPKFKDY
jgi:hypothetical protein